MNYERFLTELASHYDYWEHPDKTDPQNKQFSEIIEKVQGFSTPNVLQLLNVAVSCLEDEEVYCEVGCFQGASLIGALLNHPQINAYAVDNFSQGINSEISLAALIDHLSYFGFDDQVFFLEQNFEDFFTELNQIDSVSKIGVYFYDAAHNYRSQLMGLMLAKPFLASQALIVITHSNWSGVLQATQDFIALNSSCKKLLDFTKPDSRSQIWNGLQVLRWDTAISVNSDANSLSNYESAIQFFVDWEAEEQAVMVATLFKEAVSLQKSRDYDQAIQKYQQVLTWQVNHAEAWQNLGIAYYLQEQYQEAFDALIKSIQLEPHRCIPHYHLGLLSEKINDFPQAIQAYRQAISLNSKYLDAYNNLGNVFSTHGELEKAEEVYRQALERVPNSFGTYINLGNILVAQNKIDEGIKVYQQALELNPKNPDIYYNLSLAYELQEDQLNQCLNLGNSFYYKEEYESAIDSYQQYQVIENGSPQFYINFADCFRQLDQYEEALKIYEKGIEIHQNYSELYYYYIESLKACGMVDKAIEVARFAFDLMPKYLYFKVIQNLTLPILYQTPDQIEMYRQKFRNGLEELCEKTSLETADEKFSALVGISILTNFYLQYQGKNDIDLQRRYGEFVNRVMVANYPQWSRAKPLPDLTTNDKIRIGYVSSGFRDHVVGRLSLGWLKYCNREQFEISCYYVQPRTTTLTEKFWLYSDYFYQLPSDNITKICEQIVGDKLHILVFLDIGMDPSITQLAGLRLAPIQCSTWAHPVTSGSPTIDYFISNELMEPANAQEHYTEELVLLPNLGFCYPKPTLDGEIKPRDHFGLREDAVVYLCCQALPKYLPQYDYIFAEIARQVPHAQFVFVPRSKSQNLTQQFKDRLQKAFAKLGLNSEDYCIILPFLNQPDYFSINLISDVFLDTFAWSGGMTSLDAVAFNLPVVTCPGELMRGRQSYGILKGIGVMDTVVNNEAEYIEMAVKLGLNPTWRQEISQRMKENHQQIYDDPSCVFALEQFYNGLVQEQLELSSGKSALFSSSQKKVLHVGCGSYSFSRLHETFRTEEWQEIRLDIDPDVKPDIIGSITNMKAVPNQSVDAVWSSHNLEHVYYHEVPIALAEFYRVLKPGGRVLITLPDIQKVAEYVASGRLEETLYVSPSGPIAAVDILYGLGSAIADGKYYMAHRTGFTQETLAEKLKMAGFTSVEVHPDEQLALWATAYKPID